MKITYQKCRKILLFFFPLFSFTLGAFCQKLMHERPNIVLILADDLGYGSLGKYGATKVKTPNIDRLANEGRWFTDVHSSSSVCTPSRYSLLTGEYAWRIDNWSPVFCHTPLLIDTNKTTIASLLKRTGYSTACIGKWHLGFGLGTPDWNGELKPGPLELGFDYYYGIPIASSHPPFVYVKNHHVVGLDPDDPLIFKPGSNTYFQGGKSAQYSPQDLGPNLTQKAIDWIRENRDNPFFLYYATPLIHLPITPNPRFIGTSQCGLYGDYIQEFDYDVGQILETLNELKISDNTLVIVTSDNGGTLRAVGKRVSEPGFKNGADGLDAWKLGLRLNGDLLGFKFGSWEGGHREPFIARWPGHIPAGSKSDQLIGLVDILATIAAIVGERLPAHDGVDSYNILSALVGNPKKQVREQLVAASSRSTNLSIRKGNWLYINAQGSGGLKNGLSEIEFTHQVNSDITPDGKFNPGAPSEQLYNLKKDIDETTNVILKYPHKAEELKELLEKIRKSTRSVSFGKGQ